jgi:4-amino-4-deoxy-L-arabinose transferase-like glycosyltransferase
VGIDEVGRLRRARRWVRAHLPELIALSAGIVVRLSMALLYDARIGYDFNAHWPNIQYLIKQHALPPLELNAESNHPPLYYLIAAVPIALGLDAGALGWLSALWGMSRLVLIWIGLERWLPESRIARVVALALAGVLPAAAHLDGMITNETLMMLLSAAVFVVAPAAIAAARQGRNGPMAGLGLLLGLALMSKVSASVLVTSIAVAIGLEIVRERPPSTRWQALRERAAPMIAGALVLGAVAGPWFVRNQLLYGQAAPTGYEGAMKRNQAPYEQIPYFDRRPLGFYLAWHLPIYVRPLYPTAIKPEARFFPVLLASTFNDYYIYSYSGGGRYKAPSRSVSAAGVTLGCMSVMAGTLIALVTIVAWAGAARALWRRKDDGQPDARFALLLAPLGALLGQLHFATKYPNDNFGPIKGAYLQFVAPILCALFGAGVAWMWRRRARWRWRVPALAAMGAVLVVAAYSAHARFPRFGKDANTGAPFFAADRAAAHK